jgi:hypothetical protein
VRASYRRAGRERAYLRSTPAEPMRATNGSRLCLAHRPRGEAVPLFPRTCTGVEARFPARRLRKERRGLDLEGARELLQLVDGAVFEAAFHADDPGLGQPVSVARLSIDILCTSRMRFTFSGTGAGGVAGVGGARARRRRSDCAREVWRASDGGGSFYARREDRHMLLQYLPTETRHGPCGLLGSGRAIIRQSRSCPFVRVVRTGRSP